MEQILFFVIDYGTGIGKILGLLSMDTVCVSSINIEFDVITTLEPCLFELIKTCVCSDS